MDRLSSTRTLDDRTDSEESGGEDVQPQPRVSPQKRTPTVQEPKKNMRQPPQDGQTSFHFLSSPLVFHPDYAVVAAGSGSGFLLRVFTMLHKTGRYFYVVDSRTKRLYEFTLMPVSLSSTSEKHDTANQVKPRSIIPLHNARLEDELVLDESSGKKLYCWKLFVRGGSDEHQTNGTAGDGLGHSKSFVFGCTSTDQAKEWHTALRAVIGTNARTTPTPEEQDNVSLEESANLSRGNSEASPFSVEGASAAGPSEAGFSLPSTPSGKTWKQNVLIYGTMYLIPCTMMSTNAWLLSEAIRAYMRRNGTEPDPELTGLYNVTQHRLVDLADDVSYSVSAGDILEAICTSPSAPPSASSPRKGKKNTHNRRLSDGSSTMWRRHSQFSAAAAVASAVTADSFVVADLPEHNLVTLVDPEAVRKEIAKSQSFLDDVQSKETVFFRQLEVLCRSVIGPVPNWPSDLWTKACMVNGVHIYSSDDPTVHGSLAVVKAPVSALSALEQVLDIHASREWNPYVSSSRHLELGPANDVVFVQTKYSFALQSGFPFLAPRDFCIARCWFQLSDGTYIVVMASSDHPCCPSPGQLPPSVRGKLAGAYAIRPVRESALDLEQCLIFSLCSVDMQAPFASNYINAKASQTMCATLAGLRIMCMTHFGQT